MKAIYEVNLPHNGSWKVFTSVAYWIPLQVEFNIYLEVGRAFCRASRCSKKHIKKKST